MGTKHVRLDEDVYERVAAHNRDDETMSDTISRLMTDVSLLDLADEDAECDEELAQKRKASLERTVTTDADPLTHVPDEADGTEHDSETTGPR